MCSIRAVSSASAAARRFSDERCTPAWTNAVSTVSLLAMPNRSRSCSAPRTPSGLSPETPISSSVLTPSSAGAPISVSAMSNSCLRYAFVMPALASRSLASLTEFTRRDAGNTRTEFSSRVRSSDSSSHATAVRTLVSSVSESRSNALSSSSPRISPAVATTSPPNRFFLSRFRSALRMPWISRRVSLERADMPNCRSASSAE